MLVAGSRVQSATAREGASVSHQGGRSGVSGPESSMNPLSLSWNNSLRRISRAAGTVPPGPVSRPLATGHSLLNGFVSTYCVLA